MHVEHLHKLSSHVMLGSPHILIICMFSSFNNICILHTIYMPTNQFFFLRKEKRKKKRKDFVLLCIEVVLFRWEIHVQESLKWANLSFGRLGFLIYVCLAQLSMLC